MAFVLGGVVIAFLALLAVGVLTHRVEVRGCCAVADPACDLRMRSAFPAGPNGDEGAGRTFTGPGRPAVPGVRADEATQQDRR
jgi:hypothetical protein